MCFYYFYTAECTSGGFEHKPLWLHFWQSRPTRGYAFCTPFWLPDYAKCIVNIMKVYIKRNNLQVELIRYRNKYWLYSHLLLQSDGCLSVMTESRSWGCTELEQSQFSLTHFAHIELSKATSEGHVSWSVPTLALNSPRRSNYSLFGTLLMMAASF